MAPEIKKQADPRASGLHTSLSYSELVSAMCIAW
jgi:hypothetical protein